MMNRKKGAYLRRGGLFRMWVCEMIHIESDTSSSYKPFFGQRMKDARKYFNCDKCKWRKKCKKMKR
jgi:1,2-phenylacetyl-CoA epoxidase PaaB subunit